MTAPSDPAVGITVVVHLAPGPVPAPAALQKLQRQARLFKALAVLVALGGLGAGVMHQLTLSDPSATRATWYRVLLWLGVAYASVLVAAMAAGAVLGWRGRPPARERSGAGQPGDLWASRAGSYLGPFAPMRGWPGCGAFGPPSAGSLPAHLKVTVTGLSLIGPGGHPRVMCPWARLRQVDVHRGPAGGTDWVGMTTIDDRYARFEGRGLAGVAEQLRVLGATVHYRNAATATGSSHPP